MQHMSAAKEALGERAASVSKICGKGICPDCGGEAFEIHIWSDGTTAASCGKCGQIWPPQDRGHGQDDRGVKTVACAEDVSQNMVSPEGGEGKEESGVLTCPVCEARRKAKTEAMRRYRHRLRVSLPDANDVVHVSEIGEP